MVNLNHLELSKTKRRIKKRRKRFKIGLDELINAEERFLDLVKKDNLEEKFKVSRIILKAKEEITKTSNSESTQISDMSSPLSKNSEFGSKVENCICNLPKTSSNIFSMYKELQIEQCPIEFARRENNDKFATFRVKEVKTNNIEPKI